MVTLGVTAKVQQFPFGETPMRKIIALSIVAAALAVSACNTISGVGRDVSAAGSAVSSGAESAKH
jgi:entericidin B